MEKDGERLPTIDLSLLHHNPLTKSSAINQIREACSRYGFFNVIHHGIPDSVVEEALNVNSKFFSMAIAEQKELASDDILKPVRFGKVQVGQFSRDFLKLYAHPLDQFLPSWPRFPPNYREKMGVYSTEVRKLSIELFGAIMESLNIDHQTHLQQNFSKGFQIMGINCYPPCSRPNTKTGITPHTDHSIITVLLQSAPGFEIIDGGCWKSVGGIKGSLQVLVGDHLEVISNGLYRSVVHRAINHPSSSVDGTRLSIANLHSLDMDDIVDPAVEMKSGERMYRGSSLRDFLEHLASGDKRCFIETLKMNS